MLTIIETGSKAWAVAATDGELRVFSRDEPGEWSELPVDTDGEQIDADGSLILEAFYVGDQPDEEEPEAGEEPEAEEEAEPEDEEPEEPEASEEEPEEEEDEEPEEEPKKPARRRSSASSTRSRGRSKASSR